MMGTLYSHIMTGKLAKMIADLTVTLGGERAAN